MFKCNFMTPKSAMSKSVAAGLVRTVFIQTAVGEFFSEDTRKSADKQSGNSAEKLAAKLPSEKRSKKRMWGNWAAKDTEEYRNGYPGKKDHPEKKDNLLFYTNQLESKPDGDKIDDIHSKWFGDYDLLEKHHGYIQWLFPIRESGLNWHAQELQLHEIDAIMNDTKARKRILMSYKMMLDFYGMKLTDEETGEIMRAENWKQRFRHLNRSYHNYLRITRILKCLGEFGYEHLEPPFVKFVLQEGFVKETLNNLLESCEKYWIEVIRDEKARNEIWDYYDSLHVKYTAEQTDDTEKAPAEQSQTQEEKPRKVQTSEADNGDSDPDTMEYAMKLISDPAEEDDHDDDDLKKEEVLKGANTERKVHDLSESSDDSQEARYWQENDKNENADQEMEIDLTEDNEMGKHSDDSNDKSAAKSERNKEEVINDEHKADEMVSDEVMEEQDNGKGSDDITEMEKDKKSVDKTNEVDKDGNSEDVSVEISGRPDEKHLIDKADINMVQEGDEKSKPGNTENIETGIGEPKVDTSCKDDGQEITESASKNTKIKADGTEATDNDGFAMESEINDLESDTNNAENKEVAS